MESLSLNEAVKTLECPNCKKYITSDSATCRFCSFPISQEMIEAGVEKEDEEIRRFQVTFYKGALGTGAVFLLIGILLLVYFFVSYYATGRGVFYFWSPILILLGLGEIIYALHGFYKERPHKKK